MPALPVGDAGPARHRRPLPDRGLEVVGISVQETNADDVPGLRRRYQLDYTIGADLTGDIFRRYRLWGLPTSFFIGPDGAIRSVVLAPLTEDGARGPGRGDPAEPVIAGEARAQRGRELGARSIAGPTVGGIERRTTDAVTSAGSAAARHPVGGSARRRTWLN